MEEIIETGFHETENEFSEEYLILGLIEHLFDHLDNILFCKHIIRETQTTVIGALETALYDFTNLYFIGETFRVCNTSPETFQAENDRELNDLAKDSLQLPV